MFLFSLRKNSSAKWWGLEMWEHLKKAASANYYPNFFEKKCTKPIVQVNCILPVVGV